MLFLKANGAVGEAVLILCLISNKNTEWNNSREQRMEDKWAMIDMVDCCDDRVMGRETSDMRLTAETQCQKRCYKRLRAPLRY